jgi:8-oxo-dGTP diphosphatase
MRFRYEFPRPALTVDVAVLRGSTADREILLIRRGQDPFVGTWALPGGFVDEEEPLEDAARRELAEETGIERAGRLRQVGAYGDPGRDPRGWTVSVVFLAQPSGECQVRAGDDASEAAWFPVWDLPELAFDHAVIVEDVLRLARHVEAG